MVRLLCTWQQKAVLRYWRNYGLFFKEAQLNEDELMNKLLLDKDKYTYIDWNRVAEKGILEALGTLRI
jgi:hypothetical protein